MSSEEWEDRMQSDESTSSAYSSNSEVDSEEKAEEEEKTEYTTSTLHVINLLQPVSSNIFTQEFTLWFCCCLFFFLDRVILFSPEVYFSRSVVFMGADFV